MSRAETTRALLIATLAMAGLSGMDVAAKYLGSSLPTTQIVLFRFAGTAICLGLYLWMTGRKWPKRWYLKRHAIRAIFMSLTALFFFYGITHLPLAIATALAMSAPIYVSILGVLILKEPLNRSIGAAIALGIAGSAVIVFGGGESASATGEASLLAWAAAIFSPLTYAMGIVLLKAHAASADEGAAAMTFAQAVVSSLIVLPFSIPTFVFPTPELWPAVALLGLLAAIGYLLFIAALRSLAASVFALMDYTVLLWAAFFGYVIFAEVPDRSLWLGGALIISACFLGVRVARRTQPLPVTPPPVHPEAAAERRSSSES